jgi:membrane-bound serine protease (ClpP class)
VALAFMESTIAGFIFVGIVLVGVPVAIYLAVKLFRHSPLGKRMILSGPSLDLSGGAVTLGESGELIEREGLTHTKLRPSGIAIIDDRRVDVVSESALMIEAGVRIRVVKVEGNRVVVRPVESKE